MADLDWQTVRGQPLNVLGDLFGISFGPRGPSIGPVALLQKTDEGLKARPVEELEYVLGLAFDESIGVARYMPALAGIARALNDGDAAQAMLRVQLAGLPVLPGPDAYQRAIEAEAILKASPDDPKHPGYPKNAPDGKGGQFRPKSEVGDQTVQASAQLQHGAVRQAEKLIIRRAVRAALGRMFERRAALLAAEAASNLIPVVGEFDDAIAAGQILDMAGQSLKIYKEADVALDFYHQGTHQLDELFASRNEEEFRSFDAFKKTDDLEPDLEKRFGSAGDGYEYHHIVEQGQGGIRFSAEQLNSTRNIVKIPKLLHEEITAQYASKTIEGASGKGLRLTIRDKTFEEQWLHGVGVMRRMGIIR